MRGFLLLSVLTIVLTAVSCKGRDKCGDCPTFSGVEKLEKKQA